MKLSKKTQGIVEEVEKIIQPVYLVGGTVRDGLLGRETNDYDFTTPLSPDEIEERLKSKSKRAYLIGKRFGTIGTKVCGEMVEITTFRTEKYKKGDRKPEVEFVKDIVADLARRDFTINAMAVRNGRLIDPFNGKEALNKKIIECVGNATTRFKEDPLRMLRALRFVSQLNFDITLDLGKKIENNAHLLLDISKERWTMEMDKLLMGDDVYYSLYYAWKYDVFKYILPELHLQFGFDQRTQHHDRQLHEHTMMMVHLCPKDLELRWAALLHDIAKPFVYIDKGDRYIYPEHETVGAEMVLKIGSYLKWSNKRIKNVYDLVLNHLNDDCPLRKYDNEAKK